MMAAKEEDGRSGVAPVVHLEHWELIRDDLRDRIVRGDLAPGERLTEAALADYYQVSTGPVRTALMSLVQLGLAATAPRRGAVVMTFDRHDLDELYDVLEALEQMAAREVAGRMNEEIRALLAARLEELEAAQASGDALKAFDADLVFHRTICEVSGNGRLLGLWEQLAEQARFIIAATTRFKPSTAAAGTAHMPILATLETGNARKAEAAIRIHFDDAYSALSELSDEELAEALGGERPTVRRTTP